MATVLVIDDDDSLRVAIEKILHRESHRVLAAADGKEGLAHLAAEPVDVVLTDMRMDGIDGLEVLRRTREMAPLAQVVLITAHGTVEQAVDAMKQGAYDYLLKPVERADLVSTVRRAAERRALVVENRALAARVGEADAVPPLVGSGPRIEAIRATIRRVAPTAATVLIEGETGTGKEVAARGVHADSDRCRAPFIVVNCAALPDTLIESELFGHERGAYTGAETQRQGRFELASGGTLFLDEVGDMPLATQAKLLRVLQSGEFERLGGSDTLVADVRVIAASNRDLEAAVEDGSFREDLYYRLRVIRIVLPPLRERRRDVPLLAEHFLQLAASRNGVPMPKLSSEALDLLQRYPWPGNVRELENTIEAAVVLAPDKVIAPDALPPMIAGTVQSLEVDQASGVFIPVGTAMAEVESRVLDSTLAHFGGDKEAAARALGISARTIYRKLADPNGDEDGAE